MGTEYTCAACHREIEQGREVTRKTEGGLHATFHPEHAPGAQGEYTVSLGQASGSGTFNAEGDEDGTRLNRDQALDPDCLIGIAYDWLGNVNADTGHWVLTAHDSEGNEVNHVMVEWHKR